MAIFSVYYLVFAVNVAANEFSPLADEVNLGDCGEDVHGVKPCHFWYQFFGI